MTENPDAVCTLLMCVCLRRESWKYSVFHENTAVLTSISSVSLFNSFAQFSVAFLRQFVIRTIVRECRSSFDQN